MLHFYGGFEDQPDNDWNTPITRQDAAQFIYDGLHYLKGQDLYEEYKDNNDIWMTHITRWRLGRLNRNRCT